MIKHAIATFGRDGDSELFKSQPPSKTSIISEALREMSRVGTEFDPSRKDRDS